MKKTVTKLVLVAAATGGVAMAGAGVASAGGYMPPLPNSDSGYTTSWYCGPHGQPGTCTQPWVPPIQPGTTTG